MATVERGGRLRSRWAESLSSEVGYVGMVCFTVAIYAAVALVSLAPDGTIGKLSPIHEAAQRNRYLHALLELVGINRATHLQHTIAGK